MDFTHTKIKTFPITVIFTGPSYIFYSDYYGIVAHAVRLEPFNGEVKRFNLFTGSETCKGTPLTHSVVFRACANYIRKNECKYIDVDVEFENLYRDLSQKVLRLKVVGFQKIIS